MVRWKFTKGFKFEAMKLVAERGVTVAQVARDLDLAESLLRRDPPRSSRGLIKRHQLLRISLGADKIFGCGQLQLCATNGAKFVLCR